MELLQQNQPMKGRPATQIEVEAFASICKMQDQLRVAKAIIHTLLHASAPHIRQEYPDLYEKAIGFLKI